MCSLTLGIVAFLPLAFLFQRALYLTIRIRRSQPALYFWRDRQRPSGVPLVGAVEPLRSTPLWRSKLLVGELALEQDVDHACQHEIGMFVPCSLFYEESLLSSAITLLPRICLGPEKEPQTIQVIDIAAVIPTVA